VADRSVALRRSSLFVTFTFDANDPLMSWGLYMPIFVSLTAGCRRGVKLARHLSERGPHLPLVRMKRPWVDFLLVEISADIAILS
jgi:hypothetical protein